MNLSSLPFDHRRDERGSAVIIVMAMVAIMAIFVAVNTISLRTLDHELKLLEKTQIKRLQSAPSGTTSVSQTRTTGSIAAQTASRHE